MKIKLENEQETIQALNKIKSNVDFILKQNLCEQDATEENIRKAKEISQKILEIKYLNLNCVKLKLVSSDGEELTRL